LQEFLAIDPLMHGFFI